MNAQLTLKSPVSWIRQLNRYVRYGARPQICDDLAIEAESRGWFVVDIHPPIYQELCEQLKDDTYCRRLLEVNRADYQRRQSLVSIPQGVTRDRHGLIILPGGKICQQGTWSRKHLTNSLGYRARYRRTIRVHGDVYSLLGLWSFEYYHWLHDVLPKLWESLPYLPNNTRFLLHSNPRDYQRASLDALGIHSDRLIYQPDSGDIVARRLWYTTPLGHTELTGGNYIYPMAISIVERARANEPDSRFGSKLYISRSHARFRRIGNEQEITPVLRKFGFKIVHFETMSFRDQVASCAGARSLVGPHGAGLTNLMFCERGCKIGEIGFEGSYRHFKSMARHFGHDYYFMESAPVGLDEPTSLLHVDPQRLARWLRQFTEE